MFILASASPRRIRLLREAGFDPRIVPPSIEELDSEDLTPAELTLFNAFKKATKVAEDFRDETILSADTVVALGSRVFGKPRHLEAAKEMLGALVGRTHEVVTGVVVMQGSRLRMEATRTAVTFRSLSTAQIEGYLQIVEPLDKAGAYAAQDSPELIIQEVEGSLTNVIGLPMERVTPLLAEFGIRPGKSPLHVDVRTVRQ
jgi:septum formation protein